MDARQGLGHAFDEGLATDESGARCPLRLLDQMLAAAKADFEANRSGAGEQGMRVERCVCPDRDGQAGQHVIDQRLLARRQGTATRSPESADGADLRVGCAGCHGPASCPSRGAQSIPLFRLKGRGRRAHGAEKRFAQGIVLDFLEGCDEFQRFRIHDGRMRLGTFGGLGVLMFDEALGTLVKIRDRNTQHRCDLEQAPGRYPVDALFVLLDLLECQVEKFAKAFLGKLEFAPAPPHALTNDAVNPTRQLVL